MKKNSRIGMLFAVTLIVTAAGPLSARTIDPIVSTDWLAGNQGEVIVLDVRTADAYSAGHIPNAISAPFEVPFSVWITMRDDLLLEIPDEADLFPALGDMGISAGSKVVVVSDPNPADPSPYYGLSGATRVADTLIYAGVTDVAILDGGFTKWADEGRQISTDAPAVVPVVFDGAVNQDMFVSRSYVKYRLWTARLIDARDAEVYYGALIEPFAEKAGHIPMARSLPAPWVWDANDTLYTFKDAELLGDMAEGVVKRKWGMPCCQEIIVYCGVGGYASVWWYVLTQVLGYENVKFYDGSAQEWARDYDLVPFQWY